MGNIFCKQEEPEDECMTQMSKVEQIMPVPDRCELECMKKLTCVDEDHSKIYQISVETFNFFADEVEKLINDSTAIRECPNKQRLIRCLEDNPDCMIQCKKEMDEFIDCVDTILVNKIKAKKATTVN